MNPFADKFDAFWLSGPWRRIGKQEARTAFLRSVKTEADWRAIQCARDAYSEEVRLNYRRFAGRSTPYLPQHGVTWMRHWKEWIPDEDTETEMPHDEGPPPLIQAIDDAPPAPEIAALWDAVLTKIASRVNQQSFLTWFSPLQLLAVEPSYGDFFEGEFWRIQVPNAFFSEWHQQSAHRDIIPIAAAEVGHFHVNCRFKSLDMKHADEWTKGAK